MPPRRILLARKVRGSNFGIGFWNGLGGKPLFANESPEQVVKREALEEGGYALGAVVLAATLHTAWPEGTPPTEETWFRKLYIYLGDSYQRTGSPSGEMADLTMFDCDTLPPATEMVPGSELWLPHILRENHLQQILLISQKLTPQRNMISFSKQFKLSHHS